MELPTNEKPDYLVTVCALLPEDADAAEGFVREVSAILSDHYRYYEVVLVDNRAPFAVYRRVTELQRELPGIRLLRLSRWQPEDVGLSSAVDHSIGDYTVFLNAVTDPVELIPDIIRHMAQDGADVVMGQYRAEYGRGLVRRIIGNAAQKIARAILHVDIPPRVRSLLGFSRRALNSLTRIRAKSRHVLFEAISIGFDKIIIPYDLRAGGHWRKRHIWETVEDYFRLIVANSLLPLRLAAGLGLLASALNLLYLLYILVVLLIKRDIVEGWLTTSLTHTVMFFAIFIMLTILTEYIGRILAESRDVPLYFIEAETHSTASTYDRNRINVLCEQTAPSRLR